MRNVVKKKTKKFIAVVVAAAMVLASGITVPVKAASDVPESMSVEELSVLELDKPVTVTKVGQQFAFTADADGRYQFTIDGGEDCEAYLVNPDNWEIYLEDGTAYRSRIAKTTEDDMNKDEVVYVDCLPTEENYTLTVTRLKEYTIHSWDDVASVEFYKLRDVYAGIDDVFSGLGATFTFKDGTTFEYDGLYRWNPSTHYEDYMTGLALNSDGWEWDWEPTSNSVKITKLFCDKISVTVTGPIKESETGSEAILTGPGTLDLKIQNEPECSIKIEDSVTIPVVEPPVASIEPFGATTTIAADGGMDTGESYTLYNPNIEGIIVTYKDGTKDVLRTPDMGLPNGVMNTLYAKDAPEGRYGYGEERNRIDIISNQGERHWEKGETYPVTVKYLGVSAEFQCTVGDQIQYDEHDLYGSDIQLKDNLYKLFLNHIDQDSMLEVTQNDVSLVQGQDYEIFGWYQIKGEYGSSEAQYLKIEGLPNELGVYAVVLLGKGSYKGATMYSGIRVADPYELEEAYANCIKEEVTVSNISEIGAEDFRVYYKFPDQESVELVADVDYSFDGWYIQDGQEATEFEAGGEYWAKLTGIEPYEGIKYVLVTISEEEPTDTPEPTETPEATEEPTEEPTASPVQTPASDPTEEPTPAPTAEPVQTPEAGGGSTSGGSSSSGDSSSETTPSAAPTMTPVPSQAPGAASGPAVTPSEDTKPSEPTATPGTTDEASTPTPVPSEPTATPGTSDEASTQTPSEPTAAPDSADDDEEEEYQATTETVNKGGVKATVKTTEDGTAAVKNVKSSKKSVTVSSTVEVDGVEYTVTVIEANAFANCKKATKITLPSSVKKIKKKAFTGAKKVKTIVVKSKKAVDIKKGAFKGVNTKKITIKASKMSKKQLKKFKKTLKKAGFKGKVKK